MSSNPFSSLAEQVAQHANYGPAVQGAIAAGLPLVLNYHTHSAESDYCVSICALIESPIKLLGKDELQELAHIRGFGATEEECIPRSRAFGVALRDRLALEGEFVIYLNGEPT